MMLIKIPDWVVAWFLIFLALAIVVSIDMLTMIILAGRQ